MWVAGYFHKVLTFVDLTTLSPSLGIRTKTKRGWLTETYISASSALSLVQAQVEVLCWSEYVVGPLLASVSVGKLSSGCLCYHSTHLKVISSYQVIHYGILLNIEYGEQLMDYPQARKSQI